jgi:serine protease
METLWMVRALEDQPGVVCAQPNYILRAFATEPDDTLYSQQWHYPLINLPDAWDISTGSSDVTVAVIDTGVLLAHPDLDGQLVDGYDFVDGDDDPTDEHTYHHGTHVAGTVAAASDNGLGVAGIAWDAKVMPLRVLNANGTGTTDDILEAVKYAAGLDADGPAVPLDEPVDVINLSLGGPSGSVGESVYQEARAQGVIIIAAAGNDESSSPSYPAAYDGVVSVSAVTISESLAWYSNYGDTIDVAAPGGDSGDENDDGYADKVLSTNGDGSGGDLEYTYELMNGTSMASPHVAGVVALMKSLYPGMTPDEFDYLLEGGYLTRDIGDEGRDDFFGWGIIDAYKAVLVVQDGNIDETLPAILSVSPSVMNFGAAVSSAEVTVENSGGGTLALADGSPAWSASWLDVTASGDVGADGLGTYVVTVDREGLSPIEYFDTITFTASGGAQKEVEVNMRVPEDGENVDAGYYYILLVDPETSETVKQVGTGGVDGLYEYTFEDLSYNDSYVIFAGTDPDNDLSICGNGEACGAYMSLDGPVELEVQGDLSGLDFTTDAIFNLSSASGGQEASGFLPLQRDATTQETR